MEAAAAGGDIEDVEDDDEEGLLAEVGFRGCAAAIPRMAIEADEGGDGEAVEAMPAEEAECSLPLPSSELTRSSWPSEFMLPPPVGVEVVLFSSSISLICSCLISSFESGIRYFRTWNKEYRDVLEEKCYLSYFCEGVGDSSVGFRWGCKCSDLDVEVVVEMLVFRVARVPQIFLLLLVSHGASAENGHLGHGLLLQPLH